LALAYVAVRGYDAVRELEAPAPPVDPDPRSYGRTRRRLMVAGMARSLATLGWLAFGLAPRTRDQTPAGVRQLRLALSAGALAASAALEFPVEFVEEFVLERTYGMTKRRAGEWALERLKVLAVTLAVTLPLVELFAAAVRRAPRRWPLLATLGVAPLLVLANLIGPTLILPLFNRYEPFEGALADRLRRLAARYGVGDAEILRVDMSRQTEKANAFVTGLFGTHRIVLGDTLIEHFAPDEIEFVVAHELGHYVLRDIWRSVGIGTLSTGLVLILAAHLAARSRDEPPETIRSLLRLAFFGSVCGTALSPFTAAFSRSRERAADRFALRATQDSRAGIAAFTRLRGRNLAEDEQPPWMEILFSSHPSLGSRIATLAEAGR
jgi:STE24 endopeptidase